MQVARHCTVGRAAQILWLALSLSMDLVFARGDRVAVSGQEMGEALKVAAARDACHEHLAGIVIKHDVERTVFVGRWALKGTEAQLAEWGQANKPLIVAAAQGQSLRSFELKWLGDKGVNQPLEERKAVRQSLERVAGVDEDISAMNRADPGQEVEQGVLLVERLPSRDRDSVSFGQPRHDGMQYGVRGGLTAVRGPGVQRHAAFAADGAALKPDADAGAGSERPNRKVDPRKRDSHAAAPAIDGSTSVEGCDAPRIRVNAADFVPSTRARIGVEQGACKRIDQMRLDLVANAAAAV